MTETEKEQRRYALAISGGVCEVCDKPFVTVQVDLKNISVMQCYGDHDSVVHEVDDFVKDWIENAKQKSQRKVA